MIFWFPDLGTLLTNLIVSWLYDLSDNASNILHSENRVKICYIPKNVFVFTNPEIVIIYEVQK